jgi:Tfp pilus assembly protein PilN
MSTVRINLAPEVYQASQRAHYLKRLATSIGVGVSVVCVGLVIVGLVIIGGEKVAILKLQSDIKAKQDQVKTYSDLQEAATAQQHLASMTTLYNQTGNFSKFFQVLQDFVPQGIAVSTITISPDNTVELTATAQNFDLITKFAKALEQSNTEVGKNASPTSKPYFTNIQIQNAENGNSGVDFKLTTQMSSEVTGG